MNYDVLVVGSGLGGMESSIKLADMGYKVLLVEKAPSVGGKMILLSKVFPTLDCASCISTPKMAAVQHHPNIDVMVYSEVDKIERNANGQFNVTVRKKPTFVRPDLCTGCQQCETTCVVAVPDQYNFDLVGRRAAHIAFPQAVPKKAVIDREGLSPCLSTCPAGIKPHGYVALTRAGKLDDAFDLVLQDTPLVASLGRACFAPCEGECTRGALEGPVPIRRIKRFLADRYYKEHAAPFIKAPEAGGGKKVAVVGSGPAGLTCAFHLAKKGHKVKIFEAEKTPGGMLKTGIPAYRLPNGVVDRDILNVTALGVEIETGVRVENPAQLKDQGFDAVFVAAGTTRSVPLGVPGEDRDGVLPAMDFLRRVNLGEKMPLNGLSVIVAGGGNVAIDAARVALREGAKQVTVLYRRDRESMPAHAWEIEAAESEGVEFRYLAAPVAFSGPEKKVSAVECVRMELGEPDSSGRRRPVPVADSQFALPADLVLVAIGLAPGTGSFNLPGAPGLLTNDRETLRTDVPYIFAGGDVVTGPSTIVRAAGQGKRAAFYMDRYLRGETLDGVVFDYRLSAVNKEEVLARQHKYTVMAPVAERIEKGTGYAEVEAALTEEEALYSAGRCLDCGVCSQCGQCSSICPAGAIDMGMKEEMVETEVAAVIVSTGFKLFPADAKPQYGYGKFKNVITGMQMDRLLAPTRPYNTILRPGDGKVPENVAFILCTGSRDQTVNNQLCSRVCCMYSLKHNQLIMGALPLADVTVYYMDIRAFSKGYEEFYQQTSQMGTTFVKGRVARIEETSSGDLVVHYEDVASGRKTAQHDMVVLAVGLTPNTDFMNMFAGEDLQPDEFFYVRETDEDLYPGKTSIEGVFVAGTASGAKDIPDSVMHAGAAAALAAAHIERTGVRA